MNDKSKLDQDLAALRDLSAREVPDLDATIQTIRQRGPESGPWLWKLRRNVMALLHSVRTRPAAAAVFAGAFAVLVAMVVPISYERVVGQDVSLRVTGGEAGNGEIKEIAQGFKGALGAKSVMVEAVSGNERPSFVLHATLPKRSVADVQRATAEFARRLAATGYSASAKITPRRERVRYPAVAYAFDQIINISVDGKSAAALEQEIRDRLAQAGTPDAQVSVTDRPEGGREVWMTMECPRNGDAASTGPVSMPQIVLTKGGAPLTGGDGTSVKVQKRKIDGVTSLIVEVSSQGKSTKAEVPNADSMSDSALADAVNSQLQRAGVDARVTFAGGKISVERVK